MSLTRNQKPQTRKWLREKNPAGLLSVCRRAVVLLAVVAVAWAHHSSSTPGTPPIEHTQMTRTSPTTEGWLRAADSYQFAFPEDHAAHPRYRLEWWYYTGNLASVKGRQFGYQLTFFRTGVTREPVNPSRWTIRDLYIAHMAISDVEGGAFRSFERINRSGIGWAGANTDSYHVWNEGWFARMEGGNHLLHAGESGYGVELTLEPAKQVVVHGTDGISQKGAEPGNASHYYSFSRLKTTGRITVGGEVFDVGGLSWMDHEFGTSFLEAQQVGWDWFSIQLDDGRELMLFQIRRTGGSLDHHSSGTMIEKDGRSYHIRFDEFSLSPVTTWRSSTSGADYPTSWRIDLPKYGLNLSVEARLQDQELHTPESTGVTYWEGAVSVEGKDGDGQVRGRGYLEMTGYAGQSMGGILN